MGVPAFFRWLTKKYPSVIVNCIEDKAKEIDGVVVPVNAAGPNPNEVEFDNLYLDMNGIIHPCTHPENKPAPKNEDEMMLAIFECIDRIFRIVRPRKLLYMAIDGVAPRAKMNQQRSRRFRASKESSEKVKEIERIRADLESRGINLPPEKPKESHFDSNCITPGTPFLDRLSRALHFYIHDRLNSDPAWRGIKVILSDANAPGEGEHKIMDYIRRQRAQPGHDPNTSHVLCGADADLIMLGLATHEPNFTIIREEFRPNRPRPCEICNQVGHEMKDCLGTEMECPEDGGATQYFSDEPEFIFVRLNVLREYLEKELEMPNLPFKFDIERAIDDWVFMCFFVGNDFLPHLPSLEIREGAIDRLVRLYKSCVYKTKGWLTDSGIPDLNRVQLIMSDLGEAEDQIFKNRQQNEIRFKARQKAQKKRQKMDNVNCYSKPAFTPDGQFAPMPLGMGSFPVQNPRNEAYSMRVQGMHTQADGSLSRSNQSAAAALKAMLVSSGTDSPGSSTSSPNTSQNLESSICSSTGSSPGNVSVTSSPLTTDNTWKRKANEDSDEEEEPNDEVRLWEDGFKDRYYESKFDVAPHDYKFRTDVAIEYVKGLCWVLRYYYQGCASWEWYFPYHYAPFASDFLNLGDLSTEFPKGTKPFEPLEQLMSVFPAASRAHVPEPWGKLMFDPNSPIIDFYPEDFQIDLNGKKFAWQGVALLPFVDEKRLKSVLKNYYPLLTAEEVRRNQLGEDRLYVRKGHPGYDFLTGLYENNFTPEEDLELETELMQGMGGKITVSHDVVPYKGTLVSMIPGLSDVEENEVIVARYRDPQFEDDKIFPAIRLPNAKDLPKVLKPGDLTQEESRNWRPMIGMTHSKQHASLDISGHRALNSQFRGNERDDYQRNRNHGSYNNMPPPNGDRGSYNSNQYDNNNYNRNSFHSNSRGNRGFHRGGGSSQQYQRYEPYPNPRERRNYGGANHGGAERHYNGREQQQFRDQRDGRRNDHGTGRNYDNERQYDQQRRQPQNQVNQGYYTSNYRGQK